ncbi:SDR family oxidoreductase [Streptomyces sp. PA03-3a]|nr:SDR family oxidoreductase [Streptomyces sp. PA03-3a]
MALGRPGASRDRGPVPGADPPGRPGAKKDVAAFAAFLLSDESGFVNGAALALDGGFTAR